MAFLDFNRLQRFTDFRLSAMPKAVCLEFNVIFGSMFFFV